MRPLPANREETQPGGGTQLATAEPPLDAQAVWLELSRRDWTSLALVPAGPGLSTMPAAIALSRVCAALQGRPLSIVSGENANLALLPGLLEQLSLARQGDTRRDRVLVPVGPVLDHPPSLAIARAADCAVLCVRLHETSLSAARRAIELVGAERFAGYVLLEGGKS